MSARTYAVLATAAVAGALTAAAPRVASLRTAAGELALFLHDEGSLTRLEGLAADDSAETTSTDLVRGIEAPESAAGPPPELARAGGPLATESMAILAAGLSSHDPSERRNALFALGERGDPASVSVLRFGLLDPEPRVRKAAIDELGALGTPEAAAALLDAIDDHDVRNRLAAVDAFGNLAGAVRRAALERAANDGDARVREAAADYLNEPSEGMPHRRIAGR